MFTEALLAGGGGGSEWIEPSYSADNKTVSFSWSNNAESLIFLCSMDGGSKVVIYVDVASQTTKHASQNTYWYYSSNFAGIGFTLNALTPTSFSVTHNSGFIKASLLTSANKTSVFS